MQLWQYCLLVTARYSTCFGRFLCPSPGVLKTVIAATGACHGSVATGWQPYWSSLMDIYHPDPWHAPVVATTVFSSPDDGRRKRPKHVILQILPKLHLVGSLYNIDFQCTETQTLKTKYNISPRFTMYRKMGYWTFIEITLLYRQTSPATHVSCTS